MVVSGSPKRWDRWHIIPQLAVYTIYTTYIPLIVLAEPGGSHMLPIPPFMGTISTTIDFTFTLRLCGLIDSGVCFPKKNSCKVLNKNLDELKPAGGHLDDS